MIWFLLFASAFGALPENASTRYLDCVAVLESDVELGRRAAQLWVDEGGGPGAMHCLALADISSGFAKLGAARLEDIAARSDAGDDHIRARLMAQAAEAWLLADQPEQARTAIDSALELAPESGELMLTLSKVFAEEGRWQYVIDTVDAAEQAGFIDSDSLARRGRARLSLGDNQGAALDVVEALKQNPGNVDALVLRGDVQRTGIAIDVQIRPKTAQ